MTARAVPVPAAALGGPRAYAVWIAAVTAYSIAVLQRTTMGVAGLDATERFGTSSLRKLRDSGLERLRGWQSGDSSRDTPSEHMSEPER